MASLANMTPEAIEAWNRLNESWGQPINVISTYRDPATNARVGGAKRSQHMHGNAFDISTAGMTPEQVDELIKAGAKAGFRGFGGYNGSLHFDVGPARTWGPDYGSGSTPDYLKNALAGVEFPQSAPTIMTKGGGAVTPDQIAQSAQAQSTGMQEEKPKGLMGLFGNPDLMANLAIAFNSMRLNPDPNLPAVLSAQMKERREGREDQRKRNATAQWLRGQKLDSLAQAVESGALTGAQAISLAKTEGGKGTAAMQNYARYQQIAATEGPEAAEKFRKMFLGGQDINIDLNKGELSPGWKKIDEKFAETFNEWNIAGASDALKQTSQLRGVLNDLKEGKPLTGPLLGLQPDVVQSFLNPDALNARQQVEEVVQRNLRKILGAQFTKEEGERLISRSFDQRLSPEQNAARLEALLNQMETAAQNTAAMVNYFQENGTLRGYKGNQFSSSISSFDQMFDELDRRQGLSGGKSGGEGTMANPFKITPQTKPSDIPSGAYFIDPNGVLRQKP